MPPRVALCTDTYDEINGVATIGRQFVEFARRRQTPLLVVRPGSETRSYTEGSVTFVDLRKSGLCIPLDMGLRFDVLVGRHYNWLGDQLTAFGVEIIHISGPGDIGMLAAALAHNRWMPKPYLVAAWHTNVHQYGCMRMNPMLRLLPATMKAAVTAWIESASLRLAARFYQIARLILAPNQEILGQLTSLTGKPGRLLPHGVDTTIFKPLAVRPSRPVTLGYVGRLTPEKNVRFLVDIAKRLPAAVLANIQFLIVGDGFERAWLAEHLPDARFTGILRDHALADAYREMDLFLFPSRSDTFGLVVLEAMSTGLPVVAFELCGPMCAIENGATGFSSGTETEFVERVSQLVLDAVLREQCSTAARRAALRFDWDSVFESVYAGYETITPVPVHRA